MAKSKKKRDKKTESSPFVTRPAPDKGQAKLIIAAVVIVGGLGAWWSLSPSGKKPAPVAVTVPQNLTPVAKKGHTAFKRACAACHGENAGGSENGPPLIHITYQPGHHADGAIRNAAMFGVRQHHWSFGNMPPQDGVNGSDMDAIIAFIRQTQTANGVR